MYNQQDTAGILLVKPGNSKYKTKHVIHLLHYEKKRFLNPYYQPIVLKSTIHYSLTCIDGNPQLRRLFKEKCCHSVINKTTLHRWKFAEDGIRKSALIFDALNKILNIFLNDIIRDAMWHKAKDGRNIVFDTDILCSLSTSPYFNGKRKQYIRMLLKHLQGVESYYSTDTRCSRECLSTGKRRQFVKPSSPSKNNAQKTPTHDKNIHGKLRTI